MLLRASVLLAFASGCPSLPTASDLGEPQILALIANPPCVQPGATAELEAIVAGPDGAITPSAITWSVPTGSSGAIERSGAAWTLRAAEDAMLGGLIELHVVVGVEGAAPLRGFRTLKIGGACANPRIGGVLVDGVLQPATGAITMMSDGRIDLDVLVDGGLTDGSIVSWFSTAGAIELYRRTPTQLVVRTTPGDAVLYVVYRDGNGGVSWLEHDVQVSGR